MLIITLYPPSSNGGFEPCPPGGEMIVFTVPESETLVPDLLKALDNVEYASDKITFALVYPAPTLSDSMVSIPPLALITIFAIASVVPSPIIGQ